MGLVGPAVMRTRMLHGVREQILLMRVEPFKQWSVRTAVVAPKSTWPVGLLTEYVTDSPAGWQAAAQHKQINDAIAWGAKRLKWGNGLFTFHSIKHGRCTDLRIQYGYTLQDVCDTARLRMKAMASLYSGHADEADQVEVDDGASSALTSDEDSGDAYEAGGADTDTED